MIDILDIALLHTYTICIIKVKMTLYWRRTWTTVMAIMIFLQCHFNSNSDFETD